MARLVVASTFGVIVGIVAGAALGSHADEEIPQSTIDAASDAGVDKLDLQGALNTLQDTYGTPVGAREYLISEGLLQRPYAPPASTRPTRVATPTNARVACIEAKESGGANVANRSGSGAAGVLQYMPSTFAAHASEIGHPDYSPWVPWQARLVAAHDLALGRRSQWTVAGC